MSDQPRQKRSASPSLRGPVTPAKKAKSAAAPKQNPLTQNIALFGLQDTDLTDSPNIRSILSKHSAKLFSSAAVPILTRLAQELQTTVTQLFTAPLALEINAPLIARIRAAIAFPTEAPDLENYRVAYELLQSLPGTHQFAAVIQEVVQDFDRFRAQRRRERELTANVSAKPSDQKSSVATPAPSSDTPAPKFVRAVTPMDIVNAIRKWQKMPDDEVEDIMEQAGLIAASQADFEILIKGLLQQGVYAKKTREIWEQRPQDLRAPELPRPPF